MFQAAFVEGRHHGIGRVIVAGERIVGIDLDQMLRSGQGAFVHRFAERVVQDIGSYAEDRPVGTGLHIWAAPSGRSTAPSATASRSTGPGDTSRVSGDHLAGTPETSQRRSGVAVGVAAGTLWRRCNSRIASRSSRAAHVSLPESPAAVDLARLVRTHPQLGRIVDRVLRVASEPTSPSSASRSSAGARPPKHGDCARHARRRQGRAPGLCRTHHRQDLSAMTDEPADIADARRRKARYKLFRDLEPVLDRHEIIRGLMPAGGSLGVAYGDRSAGKTAILVDLLLHIPLAEPYRGRRVERRPVIYVALDTADQRRRPGPRSRYFLRVPTISASPPRSIKSSPSPRTS